MPIIRPALAIAAALAIGGCSTYGSHGYGGVSVGHRSHYSSYYGWYDDYYYPGVGYYIYDRKGHRHRWSDRHRRYWEGRRHSKRAHANWSGYRYHRRDLRDQRREARARHERREWRAERREDRREWRRDRREDRRELRRERRDDDRGRYAGRRDRDRDGDRRGWSRGRGGDDRQGRRDRRDRRPNE